MPATPRLFPLLALLAAGVAAPLAAQPAATLSPAGDGVVRSFRLVVEKGRSVAWAPKGDWIAYERPDAEGYSRLWVALPDGGSARCLTCDPIEFRRHHAGNPTWHPSGRYLLFQLEKPHRIGGEPVPFGTVPGRNLGDDLWAITFEGRQFWNLTNRGERGGRVLAPHFSREGEHVAWAERVASGGATWGRWVLRVGRFATSRGVPRLRDVKTFTPGSRDVFFEGYGFTADDRGLLFGASLEPGQNEAGLDLHVLRLDTDHFERLTSTPAELDRFARFSPNGRRIVWATNRGLPGRRGPFERLDRSALTPLDLWMMDANGGEAERLTGFNDVFSDEYQGKIMVGGASWNREGDRLLLPLIALDGGAGGGLYLLELDRSYGR